MKDETYILHVQLIKVYRNGQIPQIDITIKEYELQKFYDINKISVQLNTELHSKYLITTLLELIRKTEVNQAS